ncbi:MAG: hypothetical protein LW839_07825 [Cryomorphaceae bacterium]|jgi:hypothetical protein|nr:hypothetical protein [Cryomorphaceae bacterium]
MRILLFLISGLLFLWSCAPARFVEPLQKGQQVLTGHFGGPIAKVPGIGAIPIPFTSIGYGRGLSNQTTIMGALQTTSLIFGVGQFELGVSQRLWNTDRMGLSGQLNTNILFDFYTGANRIWPQLDANYYFKYGLTSNQIAEQRHYNFMYAGISNWFDFYRVESQGRPNEQLWIPSLQFGHQWIRPKWSYQAELKILAPLASNENIVVPYPSLLQNRGALGLYFGITYSL